MPVFKDLTGKIFSQLKVIKRHDVKSKKIRWLCVCDCGIETLVSGTHLITSHTTSCGCHRRKQLNIANTKHGLRKTRLYNIWAHINQRCLNSKNKNYIYYGGRGISICDEWKNSFEAFNNWALKNGYENHLTIERKNVNGNYSPENCSWATTQEQSVNTRKTHRITFRGEVLNTTQLKERYGCNRNTLYIYIKQGKDVKPYIEWSINRMLTKKQQ